MSNRINDLLARANQLNGETIEFVSNLSEPEMAAPCADPECPTVGDVVVHLGEGSKEVLGWAAATLQGQPGNGSQTPPSAGDGHSHGPAGHSHGPAGHSHSHGPAGHSHGPADHSHGPAEGHIHKDEVIQLMKRGWMVSAGMLKNLTDEQLDATPPAAPGISDGSMSLVEIISRMMDHQEQHLTYMKEALAAQAEGKLPQEAK